MKKTDKKIILVLHGFPGLPKKYGIRDYINFHNYDGVIPDLFDNSFLFDKQGIIDFINKSLKSKKPDLIVAFSMGGLIAPWLAAEYPYSKLVLVATGPRIEIAIRPYDYIIKKLNLHVLGAILKYLNHVPFNLYKLSFLLFNPFKGPKEREIIYYQDIRETYEMFTNHSSNKLREIVKFVRDAESTEILKTLKNKTLIICGGHDIMMPGKLSVELNTLIKNSEIIENKNRLHHEVFDERDFARLDDFLNS